MVMVQPFALGIFDDLLQCNHHCIVVIGMPLEIAVCVFTTVVGLVSQKYHTLLGVISPPSLIRKPVNGQVLRKFGIGLL